MELYTIADLKQLAPPKGKVTIYRLTNTGFDKKGRLMGSSQTVFPSEDTITIPRKYLKNFDEKRDKDGEELVQVLLEYFTQAPRSERDPITQAVRLVGNRGEVIFRFGTLQVRDNEIMLYNFLEYSNWNRDFAHRDNRATNWFFRIRPDEVLLEKDKKRKQMIQAIGLAYDMPESEIREYARAIQHSNPELHNVEIGLLRATMASIAEGDPEKFIAGSKSTKRKYRSIVNEAIENRLIEHNTSTREWLRLEELGNGKYQRNLIVRVPQGVDSFEFFIEYLVDDTSGLFDHLETLVKATRPKLEKTGPKV